MGALLSLVAVGVLALLVWVGVEAADMRLLFGVVIPWAAFLTFLLGIVYRVVKWARVPVPFRIPTTSGQQRALPWIKSSRLENPDTLLGVLGRMALEVLLFRSLFRNTKSELLRNEKVVYSDAPYLWLFSLVFHWSMLVVVVRHFRFFTEPIPRFVELIQVFDGFFQVGVPVIYLTSAGMVVGLGFLLWRRVADARLRYISLPADYFALYLLLAIGISGILMRHVYKVDIVQVKALIGGLMSFNPVLPEGVGVIFFIHVFLVSVLLAYFPFSKLLHMPGVFFSPTRNLANNNRRVRHVSPWELEAHPHTYAEWEDEFRDKLKESGYTLDRE